MIQTLKEKMSLKMQLSYDEDFMEKLRVSTRMLFKNFNKFIKLNISLILFVNEILFCFQRNISGSINSFYTNKIKLRLKT